jgi:hypothetical protein
VKPRTPTPDLNLLEAPYPTGVSGDVSADGLELMVTFPTATTVAPDVVVAEAETAIGLGR